MKLTKLEQHQWSLDMQTTLAFAVAFGLLIVVGVISHTQFAKYENSSSEVAHAYEVLAVINEATSDVQEAHSDMRSFVLVDQERFFHAYQASVQQARQKIQRLRSLTANSTVQQQRLNALEDLIEKRFRLLEYLEEMRKNQGSDAALTQIRTGGGNEMMEEIHKRFEEMKEVEDGLLRSRIEESNRDARRTAFILTALILLALILVAAAMLLVNRHVSQRELAESTGLQQTRIFQSILDNIADGVAVADQQGSLVLFNPAAEQILGMTDAKPSHWSKHFSLFLPDMITPCPTDKVPLVQALRGEATNNVELFVRSPKQPDGIWLRVSGWPLRNEDGLARGGVVVFQNITQQKQAHERLETQVRDRTADLVRVNAGLEELIVRYEKVETSLHEGEATFRGAFEHTNVPKVLVDLKHRFVRVNAAFARLFGYTEAEMLRLSLADITHPDDLAESYARRKSLLAGTDHYFQMEKRYRHKDGRVLWGLTNVSLVCDSHGRPLQYIGQVQDITERKRGEEQLRQAQKMEAVGQLASGVAHDFNNLLTVISGYSEMIMASLPDNDRNRGLVQEIYKAGERAASLTGQLLAFSRKAIVEPKVLDLNGIVSEAGKMLGRLIGEDVSLTVVLAPGLGRVKADSGQVEQIIMNLAVNARDAMPWGGKLTIETANIYLDECYAQSHFEIKPGRYVMLAVSDTGQGMTEEIRARIFEPFFTTKELGKGTGLGLATVYGIVKQSEGSVYLYSEPGKGTTFKVYLPMVEEEPMKGKVVDGAEPNLHGTETVLLVEDEPAVRFLSRLALQMYGYTVLEASQGDDALRVSEQHHGPIHLLLTDVVLPGLSGRQVAESLRSRHPAMKVMFVSGYTDDAVVRHGVLEAESAFLQKPFTPVTLAAKVREVLDQ